jgi:CheY-like chemotaxis protein
MAKARILVVEDEETQRRLYCEELSAAGYEAIGVGSALEAEEFLSRERVDLVVLDLNLPVVSGLELLPRIHELHPVCPSSSTPLTAVTATNSSVGWRMSFLSNRPMRATSWTQWMNC